MKKQYGWCGDNYLVKIKKRKMPASHSMDTSKRYIQMCKEAEEIQKIKDEGFRDLHDFAVFRRLDDRDDTYDWETIWLPRQDQLQNMVREEYQVKEDGQSTYKGEQKLLMAFNIWVQESPYAQGLTDTLEQLWLGFVMEKKYNKMFNSLAPPGGPLSDRNPYFMKWLDLEAVEGRTEKECAHKLT